MALVAWLLARRVYDDSLAVQEGFSSLSERTQENLNAIRTIQAQAQEEQEIRRFSEVNADGAVKNFPGAIVRRIGLKLFIRIAMVKPNVA